MLYRYQRELMGSAGAPIVDITAGTSWFYAGIPGYEPGRRARRAERSQPRRRDRARRPVMYAQPDELDDLGER
jgi:hypothetical protein